MHQVFLYTFTHLVSKAGKYRLFLKTKRTETSGLIKTQVHLGSKGAY